MYDPLRRLALSFLKVPHDPDPPAGDPGSLRVFRAGRNYLRLRLAGWAIGQVLAFAAILFWTGLLIGLEYEIKTRGSPTAPTRHATAQTPPAGPAEPAAAVGAPAKAPRRARPKNRVEQFAERMEETARRAERAAQAERGRGRVAQWKAGYTEFVIALGSMIPAWAFPVLWVLKVVGIVAYVVQMPLTYAVRRLDYEMRWYLVTDRSLRLREGVWTVAETTMSFANLQEVVVTQGPLQRLLGLADVQVKSAGGGGGAHPRAAHDDLHTGRFHSVTNAAEIRDLILRRLRRFRDAGLGDPEDRPAAASELPPAAMPAGPANRDVLAAAREAIEEARTLRAAVR
ncbi:MAG TPA: PH domain-containing protein [Opitutaceae bacterium]|nr:PH domain-containing protein [Opitutaceae bacterium]